MILIREVQGYRGAPTSLVIKPEDMIWNEEFIYNELYHHGFDMNRPVNFCFDYNENVIFFQRDKESNHG